VAIRGRTIAACLTDEMAKGNAVVDGSNFATEGRNEPSLAQLDEAVRAIDAQYDFDQIIVIVDATFEHRVAKSESKAARAAIDDGDIITPPAGVIGRGDAFILEVADRAGAVVFSNDSFQEFHGVYDWLFEGGRLVGGKPIPSVGWIYVARSPVRGPVSRRATADNRKAAKKQAARSAGAKSETRSRPRSKPVEEPAPKTSRKPRRSERKSRPSAASVGDGSNPPERWRSFKSDYPVGSTIAATVDRFSSHGAYGSVDDVVIYLPNRLLGDPAPPKARDVLELGATMDFVVHRYDDERFGIDAGLIEADPSTNRRNTVKKATKKAAAKKAPAKRTAKKTAARATAKKAPAKKTARKAPAKKSAKKAPAKKTAAKKTAKKAPAKKTAKKAPAKKASKRR
jgi:hypothetical protein